MSVFVVRILLFYIVCIFLIFSKIEATLSKVMSVIAAVCLFFPLWLPQWPHKESVHDPGSIIVSTIEEAEISTLFDLWMFVLIVKVLITLTMMVITLMMMFWYEEGRYNSQWLVLALVNSSRLKHSLFVGQSHLPTSDPHLRSMRLYF